MPIGQSTTNQLFLIGLNYYIISHNIDPNKIFLLLNHKGLDSLMQYENGYIACDLDISKSKEIKEKKLELDSFWLF